MSVGETEAGRWFRQAVAELEVVRTLIAGRHYAPACFYSQQAAEKALKAVLYSQGQRVVLGHSVRDLAKRCKAYDASFGSVESDGALLDQLYIPTRYPNGLPPPAVPSESYTESHAQSALASAERVVRVAEAFLRNRTSALGCAGRNDAETDPTDCRDA